MARLTMMPRLKLDRVAKTQRPSYRVTKQRKSKQNLTTSTAQAKTKKKASQPNISRPRDIICDCTSPPPEEDLDFFVCVTCQNLQHPDCATSNSNAFTQLRCSPCDLSDLNMQLRSQTKAIEAMQELVSEKMEDCHVFYAEQLWKHYCNLPDGNASESVLAITQTEYRDGAMVPVFAAPEAWVTEVHRRFIKMVKDAGTEKAQEIMGPSHAVMSLGLRDLVHWRLLAKWLLNQGPYRGNKEELGILGEVIGLVEKGTFWDGDWMESFLEAE